MSVAIPAICDNIMCGASFFTNAIGIAVGATTHIERCKTGPCPRCGERATIPSARYTNIGTGIVILPLSESDRTVLENALGIVKTALSSDMSVEDFKRQASQRAPELSVLWRILPDTKQDAYQFWLLVVAVIALFLNQGPPPRAELMLPVEIVDAIRQSRPDIRAGSHSEAQKQQRQERKRKKRRNQ